MRPSGAKATITHPAKVKLVKIEHPYCTLHTIKNIIAIAKEISERTEKN